MESESAEVLLDLLFQSDRMVVANQPDILVLEEGSGIDVAISKEQGQACKNFDGGHMSMQTPGRSQHGPSQNKAPL